MCGLCGELRFDGSLPDLTALARMPDKLARRQVTARHSIHRLVGDGHSDRRSRRDANLRGAVTRNLAAPTPWVARHHVDAMTVGAAVEKPPRTTWKGTSLHELWLKDPDGNLIEMIYACLSDTEPAGKPADEAPAFLVPGTKL